MRMRRLGRAPGDAARRRDANRSRRDEERLRRSAVRVADPVSALRLLRSRDAGPVAVVVADAETLRLLALPQSTPRLTDELLVCIEYWRSPRSGWRGRPGAIRDATTLAIAYDETGTGTEALVRTARPVPLVDLVAALLPAFAPMRGPSGAGFPRVAVDPTAPVSVLAQIQSWAPRRIVPFPTTLHGVGLQNAEVLVTGTGDAPIDAPATRLLPIDADGRAHVTVTEPDRRARIDLHVHHPIGRLQSFDASPAPRCLLVDGDRARIVGDDGRADAEFAIDAPLEASTMRALRGVERIDLSALDATAATSPTVLDRLAELAASGAVLHDLSAPAETTHAVLAPELAELLARPYRGAIGLERERRSVAQRRAAMHGHAGFLDFASAIEASTGQRYLPRVSVVLSSKRPDRIPAVLAMLAAQRYPSFEVVVVMHGVPRPDLSGVAEELAGLEVQFVDQDRSVLFGAAVAEGVRRSTGDLVTKLDDDDWYGPEHLWDLVLALLYSGADLVGKTTEYLYFENIEQTVHRTFAVERYHEQAAGGAMLLARATLDELGGWRPTPNSTDRSVLVAVAEAGGIAYRTHGLGYLYIRHSDEHTWVRSDSQLLSGAFEQWRGLRLPETEAVLAGV